MEDQFALEKNGAQPVDVREFIHKYLRFLPLIILSVAVALLGAYIYLRYTTPAYSSSSALIIKGSTGNEGANNTEDRFSQLFVLDNSINVQNEIEVLQSRQLMERIVDKLNLNYYYYTIGTLINVHHYRDVPFFVQTIAIKDSARPFMLRFDFDESGSFSVNEAVQKVSMGQVFTTPQGTFRLQPLMNKTVTAPYQVEWKPTRMRASELIENLVVAPKSTTGTLTLLLQTTEPRLAADVLNSLMHEYQVVTIEDKNETKRQTISFIDDRLNIVSSELDSVTASLLAYQRANNIVDPVAQSSAYLTRIDTYDEQVATQQLQVNVAQMISSYLQDRKNNYNVVPSSLGLADATLNTMISAYNVAQLERKTLVDGGVPATNARVQQMSASIEQLRLNILESLRNVQASYQSAIGRLQQSRGTVRSQVEQLPVKEQALLEIKKQQEMKQGVFNFLMEKREESAISLAATISNIKVVEEATINTTPVKPNRTTVKIIAIAIGLLLPALIIFVLELLNDKINSRADIEKLTDTPILGEVGHAFTPDILVVKPNNRGIVAEQFRIMRSNLQYMLPEVEKPVVMITSSFSGEGKSFVATNLGAVLALAGKRTVVLEFDIRKPKILSAVGITAKPGLTNWMVGKAALEDLPKQVPGYDNLYLLPCGPVPPNPAELLLNPKMAELFAWLKENFDALVMDTAPVGIVSDALTLSQYADATLFLTRQGRTFKKQLRLVNELYHSGKLPRMAVVLNDIKLNAAYGYYGYGKYGYGYAYGENSGYFEEEGTANGRKSKWFKRKQA